MTTTTNRVVTELIVDARPAAINLSKFVAELEKAGTSADALVAKVGRSGKSVTAFERDLAGVIARSDPASKSLRQLAGDAEKLDGAVRKGLISQAEADKIAARLVTNSTALAAGTRAAAGANDNFARSTGLARHELVNLSRQMQDIGTMLAMGQSPMAILSSQGAQIYDVFASSQGSVRGFAGQVAAVLTPVRLLTGGVVGLGVAAALAYSSWHAEQLALQRSLVATGRGAGVTTAQLNDMATAAARASGASISQARGTVGALAGTGRIAPAMIAPIAAAQRDVSATLGIDAAAANELLAKSFADPVEGARRLNESLGGLSAKTEDYIRTLVAAGRRQDAQQVLLDQLNARVGKATELTNFWEKAWQAVSKAASDAYTNSGQAINRAISGPADPVQGIEAMLKASQEYQADLERRISAGSIGTSVQAWRRELERVKAEIQGINGQLEQAVAAQQRAAQATADQAAADLRARNSRDTVAINERIGDRRIEQLRGYAEEYRKVWQTIREQEQQRNIGGPTELADAQLARARRSLAQLKEGIVGLVDTGRGLFNRVTGELAPDDRVMGRLTGLNDVMRTRLRLQQDLASAQTNGNEWRILEAQRNLTAFEQNQRGTDAGDRTQRDIELEGQLGGIRRRNTDELIRAARERALTSDQNIAALRSEIATMGASVGVQERARVEQQMLVDAKRQYILLGRMMPQSEVDAIRDAAKAMGDLRQQQALSRLGRDTAFERQTMFLSDGERNIANQMRQVWGDDGWQSAMQSREAAMLRFNDSLRTSIDLASEFGRTFVNDIMNGKSATEALGNAVKNLGARLIQMAMDQAIKQLFGGLLGAFGGAFGGPLNLGGFMSAGGGGLGVAGSGFGLGSWYANGGAFSGGVQTFAKGGAFTNSIVSAPTLFPMANGAGLMGEAGPEAIMPLKRDNSGRLGVSMHGGGGGGTQVSFAPVTNITVQGSANESTVAQLEAVLEKRDRAMEQRIPALVQQARMDRRLKAA